MTRRILAGIAVAVIFLGIVPTVTAAPPDGKFSLVDPRPRLIAGEPIQGELEKTYIVGKTDLTGVPDGEAISLTGEIEDAAFQDDRPVTVRPEMSGTTGTASLSVTASVDPTTGAVTGTWSATLDSSMWGESYMPSKKDPSIITTFIGHQVGSYTWTGDVTGTVGETKAELVYSGQRTTTRCTSTTQKLDPSGENAGPPYGPDDCVPPPILEKWTVAYAVAGAPAATASGGGDAEPRGIVSSPTGAVSYSPADQADLEPGARTWIQIKPGDKILMQDGVTLRTGRDGEVKILYVTGALVRLHPSTMLTMKPPEVHFAKTWTVWSLLSGIVDTVVNPKHQGVEIKPGYWVETDTAITSIKGTRLRIAVIDGATVVTTTEGIVAVTARATNQTVEVGAGQAARVEATGVTIGPADPADILDPADLLDLDADPVAVATAVPADTAPADGGAGLPIVPIAAAAIVVVVIGAVAVVAVRRGKPKPSRS